MRASYNSNAKIHKDSKNKACWLLTIGKKNRISCYYFEQISHSFWLLLLLIMELKQ